MPKPVIAMVSGFALGGGLELAMGCHLRIAADCSEGRPAGNQPQPHPGFGSSQRLLRLAGARGDAGAVPGRRADLRERALQLGIVNRVVPAAELQAETTKLAATQLAASAPLALRGCSTDVNVGGNARSRKDSNTDPRSSACCSPPTTCARARAPFLDKRKPAFTGK